MAGVIEAILRVSSTAFKQGLNEAKTAAVKFKKETDGIFKGTGGAMMGALGIGGLAAGFKSIVGFAGGLQDTADATNVNVEALQELRHAFGQSGASAETVDKSLIKLNDSLASARAGNEATIKSFAALGVTLDDIRQLTPDQILMKMAEGFKAAADPSAALAATLDVLGKSGGKMAAGLSQGADEMARLRGETDKLTESMVAQLDAADDAIGKLQTKMKVGAGNSLLWLKWLAQGMPSDDIPSDAEIAMGQGASSEDMAKARIAKESRAASRLPVSMKPSDKEFAEAEKLWGDLQDFIKKSANERIDDEKAATGAQAEEAKKLWEDLEEFKKHAANDRIDEERRKEKEAAETRSQARRESNARITASRDASLDQMAGDMQADPHHWRANRERARRGSNRAFDRARAELKRHGVDPSKAPGGGDMSSEKLESIKSVLDEINGKTEPLA